MNVFVDESRVDEVIATLAVAGVVIDAPTAAMRAHPDGMFVASYEGMRVDVFLPSIPFSHEALRTRVHASDETGWRGWFLSAESVAVFKLLFFRGKDDLVQRFGSP